MGATEDLDEMLDDLAYNETKEMLKLLADNLTKKTRLIAVPRGTGVYTLLRPNSFEHVKIPLISFFGMYVGYNKEFDVLISWRPVS